MANTSVDGVINALKREVKHQESLKKIEGQIKSTPVKTGLESKPKHESNASFIRQSYNKEIHHELLRAIQILERAKSEGNRPVAIGKSDQESKHEVIVRVLEEQYNIQETLEVISKKGHPNADIKVQVYYEHNNMYKRELSEALDYMLNVSQLL